MQAARLMTLNVNGQMRRVDVMKQETLAMTLRYKLGLTGTKLGCDRSECGRSSYGASWVDRHGSRRRARRHVADRTSARGRGGRRRLRGGPDIDPVGDPSSPGTRLDRPSSGR